MLCYYTVILQFDFFIHQYVLGIYPYINISRFILFLLPVKNLNQLSDSLLSIRWDFSPLKSFVTTPKRVKQHMFPWLQHYSCYRRKLMVFLFLISPYGCLLLLFHLWTHEPNTVPRIVSTYSINACISKLLNLTGKGTKRMAQMKTPGPDALSSYAILFAGGIIYLLSVFYQILLNQGAEKYLLVLFLLLIFCAVRAKSRNHLGPWSLPLWKENNVPSTAYFIELL